MTSNHDSGPDLTPEAEPSDWAPATFLTPAVSAVAAFTLAVTALMGQNIVTVGVSTVLGPGFGPTGPSAFYAAWGVGTILQVGLVLIFARRAIGPHSSWEGTLARAAVVIAAVAVVASVLVVVGGLLNAGPGF